MIFTLSLNTNKKNYEFKTLPNRLQVTLPRFNLRENNREPISKQIGSLSKLEITWLPMSVTFLDELKVFEDLNIREHALSPCNSLQWVSKSEFWACQNDKIIRLYNLRGELLKSIQTKSGKEPKNIALTRNGDTCFSLLGTASQMSDMVHGYFACSETL